MKINLKPIPEQVVVIFGASSGIGRETALQFARQGARVVVSARNSAGLDSLVEEIRSAGGEATAIVADVTDFEQVRRVADMAVETYGRIDTWVHTAAVSMYATFDETTPEEFKRVIDVNLVGQAYGAMAALPHLKREGRGALIHISSVEARRSLPFQSAYAASKHGVEGFIEALRMELEHAGYAISVTNVIPASINTPLFDKARTKLGVMPKGVPPFYEPQTVAEVILHAAEHPTREVAVGGSAKMLIMNQSLSRRASDAMVKQMGFQGQQTDIPKPANAPDNLFAPIAGYDRVNGSFGDEVKPFSLYATLQRKPVFRWAISAMPLLIAAAAVASTRMAKNDTKKGLLLRPFLDRARHFSFGS